MMCDLNKIFGHTEGLQRSMQILIGVKVHCIFTPQKPNKIPLFTLYIVLVYLLKEIIKLSQKVAFSKNMVLSN